MGSPCNIARSSKGRTTAFEAVYLGSIPSLAAEFAFFTSEAILFKKAKNRFVDVSLETQ